MSDDFLSDEDRALFRQMMRAVKPLQKNKKIDLAVQKNIRPLTPVHEDSSTASTKFGKRSIVVIPKSQKILPPSTTSTQPLYLSDYYTNEVQADNVLSYCSHSIPSKRLRELRSGQIQWQSRLDLHGLKPDAAKETLIKFIIQQSALAHRCLLIIHGKGSHQGEAPVLKNLVNYWLPQFPQVLAFHSALARDGGSGALYILLKRQREEPR